jgi:hypothetical protein
MRQHALPVLAVVVSALAIVALAAASPSIVSPLVVASGPSPFAACTVGGPGTVYVNAEVEPFVAVNPTNPGNVIAVWQQDRWSNGGSHGLVTGSSMDGGSTWSETFAHFSTCAGGTAANGGAYDRASDPWVSFGPDGKAYQVSLSVSADQVTSAVLASTSADGGQTWTEPSTIISETTPFHFNDKESITADPHQAGTAYVVWDRSRFPSDSASLSALQHSFAFRGSPFFSKTTDGGQTWSAPTQLGPNQNIGTIGNQIVVEPDGTLIDAFHFGKGSGFDDPNASLIGVMRSTDGGARWSEPIVVSNNPIARDVDPDNGVPLRTGADVGGAIPDVGVDPVSGAVYLVWEDSRFSGTHNDIAFSKSTDDGKTWSTPIKVNQTPAGVEAFTPVVDVASDGTVAVTYYDIRNNTPDPGLPTDYWIVHSHDGGTTWSPEAHVAGPFDYTTAPLVGSRGYFIGDYQGLANDGATFLPFFIQTNSGKLANRTDGFATHVTK